MAIQYTDQNRFKALVSILEDYTDWFSSIALYVAYPEDERVFDGFSIPDSFKKWINNPTVRSEVTHSVRQPIIDIFDSLSQKGEVIIEGLRSGDRPSHDDFVEFKNLYTSFLTSIRRLEKDSGMKGDGTDELTGLRPLEAIEHDMNKEMQRLSRNGNPFALVLARIDGFESHEESSGVLSIAVDNLKKSMRPFDDAYYLNEGQFLLSLKHSDLTGADAAIARIQHSLSSDENNVQNITISCCMAEPVMGDEVFSLLETMKADLNNHASDSEAVLKFLDVSPLERFLNTKK